MDGLGVRVLVVFVGGGLGSLARFGVGELALRLLPGAPLGTFAVNVLGSLVFGVLFGAGAEPERFSPVTRLALLTGFLGGFTTFSALTFESGQMLRQGQWTDALVYMLASNTLGVAAFLGGLWVGSVWLGGRGGI